MITLRSYQPDDAPALLALFRDTIRRVNTRDYSPTQVAAWASDDIDTVRWFGRFNGRFVPVAEEAGRPVGFAELEANGHIDRVYVSADHQRRGIGRRLLNALVAEAHQVGLTRLFTEASITARPFFEAQGFTTLAPQVVTCRGAEFVNYRMERMIAEPPVAEAAGGANPDPVSLLMVQFLDWVASRPRTYAEAMDAWRTSCPRQSVWEDALIGELIRVGEGDAGGAEVTVTSHGQAVLAAGRPDVPAQKNSTPSAWLTGHSAEKLSMARAPRPMSALLAACVLLALPTSAFAQADSDPPVEEIGKLRAKVKRAADRPSQPIVSADVSQSDASDDDLTVLEGLSELRVLDLSFTRVTDRGLSHLVGLRKLESLHLHGQNITDEGLARLKALPALRELAVTGPITWGESNRSITDTGLAHLKEVRTLESLHVGSAAITDAGLAHLKGLSKLKELQIGGTSVTDAGLAQLKGLSNLELLNLAHIRMTNAGLEHLAGLKKLQKLYMAGTGVTDAGLVHLKGLTDLRSIDLSGTKVTDAGLPQVRALPKLEWLDLGRTAITDKGLEHLKGWDTLWWLELDDTHVTDAGLAHLAGLTGLGGLQLSKTKVTDAGLAHLKDLKRLRYLTLSWTAVTDAGLGHLKVLPALREVSLFATKVTDSGVSDLVVDCPKLKVSR